jgi:hypothetical protein
LDGKNLTEVENGSWVNENVQGFKYVHEFKKYGHILKEMFMELKLHSRIKKKFANFKIMFARL